MRADQRRLVLLQVFNVLLIAVAAAVLVVGAERSTAHYAAPGDLPASGPGAAGWVEQGLFGALVALAGGLCVLLLGVAAFRRMGRGERYAPLFTALGWALLWLPLTMALTLLAPANLFTPLMATAVCGAGITLSLAVLGSKKPR